MLGLLRLRAAPAWRAVGGAGWTRAGPAPLAAGALAGAPWCAAGAPAARRGLAVLALNTVADNPGARKQKKRLGRGPGSSHGKTCGRGTKGQKARSGNKGLRDGFEGGQTPFMRRIPKWGFTNNSFKRVLDEVTLTKLQDWINQGRIDTTRVVTIKDMYDAHLTGKIKQGVKLLVGNKDAETQLTSAVHLECTRASKAAIAAVEGMGGSVKTVWFNRLGLRAHLKPSKFHPLLMPKRATPPGKQLKYYLDWDNRGYLSPEMQYKERGLEVPQYLVDIRNASRTS